MMRHTLSDLVRPGSAIRKESAGLLRLNDCKLLRGLERALRLGEARGRRVLGFLGARPTR